jgi:hypothetical protein
MKGGFEESEDMGEAEKTRPITNPPADPIFETYRKVIA